MSDSDSQQVQKKIQPIIATIKTTMSSDLFVNVPSMIAEPIAEKLSDLEDLNIMTWAIIDGEESEDALPDTKEIGAIVQSATKTNSVAEQMIKSTQRM